MKSKEMKCSQCGDDVSVNSKGNYNNCFVDDVVAAAKSMSNFHSRPFFRVQFSPVLKLCNNCKSKLLINAADRLRSKE